MDLEEAMKQEINVEAEDENSEEKEVVLDSEEGASEEVDEKADQSAEDKDQIISQLQEGNRQLYNQVIRARADFENYKRRSNRDRISQIRTSVTDVFRQMLDIMDNFDRAMDAVEEPNSSFSIGMKMIHKQFLDFLGTNGVHEIPALNHPFDPHLHEAMETTVIEGVDENTVVEVLLKGYQRDNDLLRPSRVKVTMKPYEEEEEPLIESEDE